MDAGDLIQARYELAERLGRGGMAEVWLAKDSHLGRSVAIKFLAPQLSADPEFLVRFFSEAQAVARISHPNVVRVLDFGEYEESPYLVMECVPGGPLTDKVGAPIEPERSFEIIADAAHAAGAAHALGIIHRDIKPGNILLDEDGRAKLADFGIASSGRSERLTATGAAIGSPHYISPEQASGGDATPASDVYSLGIVLYELLTGVRPFEGDNVTAVAIAQVDQEPAPPSEHVPELGPAIDSLVLRCLAKDPSLRFESGEELATALERFEVGAPTVAEVESGAGARWWASRGVVVGAGLLALLLAVPVVGVLASGDEPKQTAAQEAQERMPDVGLRRYKGSPTPTAAPEVKRVATPRPSPTPKEARVASTKDEQPTADNGGTGTNEEPAPEPTPEPTEPAPTPQPTDDGTPAP